jgi:hypothetical protein
MNINELTIEHVPQIEAIVRRLASEQPDRVASCVYVEWDRVAEADVPCCIVGAALVEMGVSTYELRQCNLSGVATVLGVYRESVPWLCDVQSRQDEGCSWSRAVASADGMEAVQP